MAFFVGSTVLMADGSRKPDENIIPGDYVKDFQGNSKLVDGIRVQNSYVNPKREQWLINEKYLVTDVTTLITPDYHFYTTGNNPYSEPTGIRKIALQFIGLENRIRNFWTWLDESYLDIFSPFVIGITIKKEDDQTEQVTSLRQLTDSECNPALNKTYSFSVKGGTMWVDGYLTTARLNEDFDYKTMLPIEGTVTVTSNTENTSQFLRVINIDYSANKDSIWDSENDCWIHAWQKQ